MHPTPPRLTFADFVSVLASVAALGGTATAAVRSRITHRSGRSPRLVALAAVALMLPAVSASAAPPPPGHVGFSPGPNSPITVGSQPRAIASGDFDGDGNLDLATANAGSDSVTPMFGNGLGGFTGGAGVSVAPGDDPRS
ncbi:MAG: hypothetical protein QOG87_2654, partial [Actinomycetota bacterium]